MTKVIIAHTEIPRPSYDLWIEDGRMGKSPAGPRLYRIPKILPPGFALPQIKFSGHATHAEAETHAALLRKYLADLPEKKVSKKEARMAGAD